MGVLAFIRGITMKKIKQLLLVLTVCVSLAVPSFMPADVSAGTAAAASAAGAKKTAGKNGWRTVKGKKYYYKNGIYLTGLQKIKSRYYYFDKKGRLKTTNIKSGGWTYYTTLKGVVDGKKKGKTYYTMSGKKLTGSKKADYQTKLRARSVARQITNDKMSLSQKRLACFNWVKNHPYMHWRNFSMTSGWMSAYADDHFLRGRGNCISDACAFAYLAQAIGYSKVYICLDEKRATESTHAWCELDGRAYDPLFASSYGMGRAYNASYSVFPDPWVSQRIRLS